MESPPFMRCDRSVLSYVPIVIDIILFNGKEIKSYIIVGTFDMEGIFDGIMDAVTAGATDGSSENKVEGSIDGSVVGDREGDAAGSSLG